LYLLKEKWNGIHSVQRDEVPEIRLLKPIFGFQTISSLLACYLVRLDMQFFSDAVEISFFRQGWLSNPPPLENYPVRL